MKAKPSMLLACITVLGCANDSESVTGPPDNSPGELSVTLEVTGDPAAGYADYPVYSDQNEIGRIKSGETLKFPLDGFSHVITLGPLVPAIFGVFEKQLSWCQSTTPESFAVHPTLSHPVHITFGLNCPPLTGEGEIRFTFRFDGTPKSDIVLDLYRLSATPNHVSLTTTAYTDASVRLSPGLYSVDAIGSNCQLPYVDWLFGDNHVIVRKDSTVYYGVNLDCD